jgi:hydrogenase nickel insertion protein HypA
MHEMTVATSLVEEILGNIRRLEMKDGVKVIKVEEVVLEIGELAFIAERQLGFCYELLSAENELLKGSKLTMTQIKAEVKCDQCGYGGALDQVEEPADHRLVMSFACPKCGGTLQILKGRGMILRNISLRTEDEDEG